jgi:hypothetical protein
LRTFFNQEGAPTDDQVARFVKAEMNGCTEIVAAQAQVREWARQAHAKRHKAETKAQAAPQTNQTNHNNRTGNNNLEVCLQPWLGAQWSTSQLVGFVTL